MTRTLLAGAVAAAAALLFAGMAQAAAAPPYTPINPTMADRTITLTGKDLTIDQVVQIARHGAKVQLSAAAKKLQNDTFNLVIEASAEGIAVYAFNRGAGDQRETVMFKGDPYAPENVEFLTRRLNQFFNEGPKLGMGPEVSEEEITRALMAVRANTMVYEAASPQLSQLLVDMLNNRVAPVVQSRGSLGEADLAQVKNVLGAMGGKGEAYFRGERMSAAQALSRAGLKPLLPMEAVYTSSFTSTNAYSVGLTVLMLADAKQALDWGDLIYAMDLNAMNSSVTPLSSPVQRYRPFKWPNLVSARILDMLKGSYLFDDDPKRIIQDPESLRASFSRQGGAWKAWATLRDTVTLQINSSDHNPAMIVGASPSDSWELSTPQMMKYYVKGGPRNNGQHGYVFSNAAWDPYPMANEIEALSNAMANMGVAVTARNYRFGEPFFTVIEPKDVLSPEQRGKAAPDGLGYDATAAWHDMLANVPPQPPEGIPLGTNVEELQAETALKAMRARHVVDDMFQLLGLDLMTATYWLDIRAVQTPGRKFGAPTEAAWAAFRKAVLWQQDYADRPARPESGLGYAFVKANSAAQFYPPAAREMDGGKGDGRP